MAVDKNRNSRAAPVELARFNSMAEMSARTGIPVDLLKQAKHEGCDFNRHHRYDLFDFLRWFFARPESAEGENWDRRKKRVDTILKERDLAERDRELIRFESARRFAEHLVRDLFFGALERYEEEFPVTLKAKDSVDIHLECKKQFGMMRGSMEAALETWIEQEGKKDETKDQT